MLCDVLFELNLPRGILSGVAGWAVKSLPALWEKEPKEGKWVMSAVVSRTCGGNLRPGRPAISCPVPTLPHSVVGWVSHVHDKSFEDEGFYYGGCC